MAAGVWLCGREYTFQKQRGRICPPDRPASALLFLALLIGNRAGGLAGRLAGGLALAAAALCRRLLEVCAVQGLDMLHWFSPSLPHLKVIGVRRLWLRLSHEKSITQKGEKINI